MWCNLICNVSGFKFSIQTPRVFSIMTAELKNKVSEEEQLAKKAEAAQRRRLQVEKAARESQVLFLFPLLYFLVSKISSVS